LQGLLGFILAGLALAGSPGPNTLSLAAAGAAFGVGRSLAYLVGLCVGMIAVMAIVASGLAGLLLAVPGAAPAVIVLSAAYFVYLAWRIATAPPLTRQADDSTRPKFSGGLFLSLVNPKGYAAMAAMFSSFTLLPDYIAADIAEKIAVLTTIIVAVNIAWLHAGRALTRFFHDPRSNRIVNIIFAILLLASLALAVRF
jgi:threonine/homoserine/homoserine lactone efflux protein